ncbi:MAG: hypothetical protein OHK0029_40410 [Armatimonadaceae bacterium]
MHIGILTLSLQIPGSFSLKDKRHAIKSLVERLRNRFNVSVAEVGELEIWQRAVIGVCVVSNDTRVANKVLSQIVNFVENNHLVLLDDYDIEITSVGSVSSGDSADGASGIAVPMSSDDHNPVFDEWFRSDDSTEDSLSGKSDSSSPP